ncbi:MAG: hypothetical protein IJS32_00355 [Kiritimatiellae bacterium]|nr:hypothetical protein [Kiritimatiellia bacterium]
MTLLRLSKNAFVRQYGPFTYVLERIGSREKMFLDAEPFLQWIAREAREKKEIVERISGLFAGVDRETVERNFDEFLAPLLAVREFGGMAGTGLFGKARCRNHAFDGGTAVGEPVDGAAHLVFGHAEGFSQLDEIGRGMEARDFAGGGEATVLRFFDGPDARPF